MSYIVPRDKPQNCWKCLYINQDYDCRLIKGSDKIKTVEEQYEHCPLIEVPTPHGRLIDADAIQDYNVETFGQRLLIIDTAPTVIEAED